MIQPAPHSRCIATSLRLEAIDDDARLAELASAWNALAQGIVFRSHDWLATWWRHYRRPHDRLCVLAAYDLRNALVGLAPWYRTRHWAKGRVLRFLGTGEVCSDHLSLLCSPGWEPWLANAVAQWLNHEAAGTWDLLELDAVDAGDMSIQRLSAAMVERGHAIERHALPSTWSVALPGEWEELLATLSKNQRKRVRGLLSKMIDTPRAVVRTVEHLEELPQGFDILRDLHQRRRLSLGQPGCFASPRYEAFHREVCQRLLAAGRLRLQWLELGGRPSSVTYDLLGDRAVYSYQAGMAPELKGESPGGALLAAALRQAVSEGYESFDLLRGDEAYKTSWQATPRGLETVALAAGHLRGRLRQAACDVVRAAGRIRRSGGRVESV